MHFVIMGSGAVGGYFGGRLAQVGEKVTFIARNQHFQVLKEDGLQIKSIKGDIHLTKVDVTQTASDIKEADVIFIAVKSFQLASALKQIKPIISKSTRIIPLLNGVNTIEAIRCANIASENVYGGLAKIISHVKAPGIISHTGAKPHITLGLAHAIDNAVNVKEQDRLTEISNKLTNAGISVGLTSNIHMALWRKFIFVAAWGALASVVKTNVGILRSHHATKELLEQIVTEYAQLANAENVVITETMVKETMAFIGALPEHSETSMQKDIAQGMHSEFAVLVEYPKQLAEKHRINTPVLTFCYACLSAQLSNKPNKV